MEPFQITLIVLSCIVFAIFLVTASILLAYFIKNRRAIMQRARKIDPTVRTLSEAQIVLMKDVVNNRDNK